ncbi:DUF3102 domain-containing protein [Pleurocapsales cyanobacterium LEGE 06147]|nr:DUF3102 domain-containing protein [Pleurocapsales cyanobacterium LEGE 06147]
MNSKYLNTLPASLEDSRSSEVKARESESIKDGFSNARSAVPPEPETRNFDYAALSLETRVFVQQSTRELKDLMRQTAQGIIEIGQKLIAVKAKLGHGQFQAWLQSEFSWSEWTARKYMQVSRVFKTVNFTDLSIASSALYLLASAKTPEEARQEVLERASNGEAIGYAVAKSIVNQHKQETAANAPISTTNQVSESSHKADPEDSIEPTTVPAQLVQSPESSLKIEQFECLGRGNSFPDGLQERAPDLSGSSINSRPSPPQERQCFHEQSLERKEPEEQPLPKASAPIPRETINERVRVIWLERERTRSIQEDVQTFEITSPSIRLAVEANPGAMVTLFEQMQSYPSFAEEVFRRAKSMAENTTL